MKRKTPHPHLRGNVCLIYNKLAIVTSEKGKMYEASMAGRLKLVARKSIHAIAVGDKISFQPLSTIGHFYEQAQINFVHNRTNHICRALGEGIRMKKAIVAANISQLFIIMSIRHPRINLELIDRMLAESTYQQIPAAIVMNKWDLADDEDRKYGEEFKRIYATAGIPVYPISAHNGWNLSSLPGLLYEKTTLFMGQSGVGKSTVINQLIGSNTQYTQPVNQRSGKGIHTTTNRRILELPGGGRIIDVPGVDNFGLVLEPHDLSGAYPEIAKIAQQCQFSKSCQHIHEPGCVVLHALENGSIAPSRYKSYMRVMSGLKNNRRY